MDIDPDISKWVLEFILKEPNNYHTLNMLLLTPPLPNNNLNFLKHLLLKKLELEISHNPVSESTLELLEQLEEIEFHRGIETVIDSMKRAYCAVIVECTVNHVPDEDYMDDTSKYKFFQSVKKVWRGKTGRMERVLGKRGLSSEELRVWKDEMEAAVWDDSVYENVVKKSKAISAVEAVTAYLREEWEKMGPSFLELVAEKVKDDKSLQRILGVEIDNQVSAEELDAVQGIKKKNGNGVKLVVEKLNDDETKEGMSGAGIDEQVAAEEANVGKGTKSNDGKGVHMEKIEHKNKLVGVKCSRVQPSRSSRGAKIADSDEMPAEPSHKKYKLQNSEEIKKVREALESSAMELQAVVTDPLPGALRMAEEISGMMSKSEKDHIPVEEDRETKFVSNMPKRSLMERSNSAHTHEWDEPTDVSPQEELTNTGDRLQLSRPRIINISPPSKDGVKNLKARRKNHRWNTEEEDTLRAGVKKYGVGNWKVILTTYRDTFVDRTEVDLKDKWRNMTR